MSAYIISSTADAKYTSDDKKLSSDMPVSTVAVTEIAPLAPADDAPLDFTVSEADEVIESIENAEVAENTEITEIPENTEKSASAENSENDENANDEIDAADPDTEDGGIVASWYIAVNDVPVARASSSDDLSAVLDRIKAENTPSGAVFSSFVQDVSVAYGYVSSELPCGTDECYALLCRDGAMALQVISTETVLTSTSVPFSVIYEENPDLYLFQTGTIKYKGKCGVIEKHTDNTYNNGVLTASSSAERLTVHPAAQIEYKGTKNYTYTSTGEYIWPVNGRITSYFGYRNVTVGNTYHKGIDIGGDYGTVIRAADSGTVTYAAWKRGYGYLVEILHDNGNVTRYAHCSGFLTCEGARVYQGQPIAKMGSTGVSTGVHLHFEIRLNDEPVDPLPFLP